MSSIGSVKKQQSKGKVEEPTGLRGSRFKRTRGFSPSPTKSTSPILKNPKSSPTKEQSSNRQGERSGCVRTNERLASSCEDTDKIKKRTHNILSDPKLNLFFKLKTFTILNALYPKSCGCSKPNLVYLKVKGRESIARCSSCHKMVSLTANTPFQGYKSNLAYLSFIIWDMVN